MHQSIEADGLIPDSIVSEVPLWAYYDSGGLHRRFTLSSIPPPPHSLSIYSFSPPRVDLFVDADARSFQDRVLLVSLSGTNQDGECSRRYGITARHKRTMLPEGVRLFQEIEGTACKDGVTIVFISTHLYRDPLRRIVEKTIARNVERELSRYSTSLHSPCLLYGVISWNDITEFK